MNAPSARAGSSHEEKGARWQLWAALAFVVCLVAISRQSLWIDEALTAVKASQAGLHGWWAAMMEDKASDLQMPLYMIYIWGFAKIAGTSEWALRSANIPWFVAGMAAFAAVFRGRNKLSAAWVALLSPFAWYYLDEARPYAMQVGASAMIFAALCQLSRNEKLPAKGQGWWVVAFFFGIISLSGSSLLGMIWAGAACLAVPVVLSLKRLIELAWVYRFVFACSAGCLVAIGAYYLWTLKLGARASDVGRTDARNVMFIAYELFGLSGLGPGRLEIRDGGLGAFLPYAKQLAIFGVLILDVFILGCGQLRRRQSGITVMGLCVVVALPVLVILGAGWVKHFRVLGRHFAPLLLVILSVMGLGLQARWSRAQWWSKALAVGFMILSVASCLSYRLATRHQKDDYRDAASYANKSLTAGQTVWWNAGREGAIYYQVPVTDSPEMRDRALWLMNPGQDATAKLPTPEIIIMSKPDVYDGHGVIAEYLHHRHFVKADTFQAFTIWRRPAGLAVASSTNTANLIE